MKKTKRQQAVDQDPAPRTQANGKSARAGKREPQRKFTWWPWAGGAGAVVLALLIYGPALNGPFVFDDLYFPYADARLQYYSFLDWVRSTRPVLETSFWTNY